MLDSYTLVPVEQRYPLPETFNFQEYIEIERELWMLFPETDGKRVNFHQSGIMSWIYVESPNAGELQDTETYFLMPVSDGRQHSMKAIRMIADRRLTLHEYRMVQLTAVKLIGKMNEACECMATIGEEIFGEEVLAEVSERLREVGQQ
jgi:hypothetical protein